MLTPTPDLSVDELLELESLVNNDAALALSELVRRLQVRLPQVIARKNELKGWTTAVERIPSPAAEDILVAPVDLTSVERNCVLVAFETETTPQGVGAFKNIVRVRIWSVEGRASTSRQVLNHIRRIQCVRVVLFPFLRGCVTPEGELAWDILEPRGYQMIGDRRNFSGVAANYTLIQSP